MSKRKISEIERKERKNTHELRTIKNTRPQKRRKQNPQRQGGRSCACGTHMSINCARACNQFFALEQEDSVVILPKNNLPRTHLLIGNGGDEELAPKLVSGTVSCQDQKFVCQTSATGQMQMVVSIADAGYNNRISILNSDGNPLSSGTLENAALGGVTAVTTATFLPRAAPTVARNKVNCICIGYELAVDNSKTSILDRSGIMAAGYMQNLAGDSGAKYTMQTILNLPGMSSYDATLLADSKFTVRKPPGIVVVNNSIVGDAVSFSAQSEAGFLVVFGVSLPASTSIVMTLRAKYFYFGPEVYPTVPVVIDGLNFSCVQSCYLDIMGPKNSTHTDKVKILEQGVKKSAVRSLAERLPSMGQTLDFIDTASKIAIRLFG